MASPPEPIANAQSTMDVRRLGVTILACASAIVVLKYMQDVFIPLILSGLIFYALDPLVDLLQRGRVPRAIGAALVLITVAGGAGIGAYQLSDDALVLVEELPVAARRLRSAIRPSPGGAESVLSRVQRAADDISSASL